jgi:hypothetical protein
MTWESERVHESGWDRKWEWTGWNYSQQCSRRVLAVGLTSSFARQSSMNLSVSSSDTWGVCACACACACVRVCVCACACVCTCVQGCLFQRLWPLAFRYLEEHLRHKRHESTICEGTLRTQLYCGTQTNSLETPPERRSSTRSTGTRA